MCIIVLKPLQRKQDSQKLQSASRLETTEHHKYNIHIIHVYMQLLFSGMHVNCAENSRTDDPHVGALVKTASEICPSFSSVRSSTFFPSESSCHKSGKSSTYLQHMSPHYSMDILKLAELLSSTQHHSELYISESSLLRDILFLLLWSKQLPNLLTSKLK